MEEQMPKGLSRRSQFLLWLLQHQPEVIEVIVEYQTDEDADDIMTLEENHALAESMCADLMDGDYDLELEAQRDYLEAMWHCKGDPPEADRESGTNPGPAQ
jgi:hypothetical protein